MNTSQEYINMRLAAIPYMDNGVRPKLPFNYYIDEIFVDSKGDFYIDKEEDCCQLERQDQLQEMVCGFPTALGEFNAWLYVAHYDCSIDEYPRQFNSMEQLWLAFVMSEKYNKKWNGKEWVSDG
ncbi:MAG: hypothetical protein SVR08_11870 [Spirochaetota bacterium]|nr:hypothetical protein [Thermodesulfobacteriota bacterium]MDY6969332.1 hypothetical protein [Spirochaetota bacterium]